MRYRLSVSGTVVTKISGFDAPSEAHAIATAHNRLKSGEFAFLEKAELDLWNGADHVPVVRFELQTQGKDRGEWVAFRPTPTETPQTCYNDHVVPQRAWPSFLQWVPKLRARLLAMLNM